MIDIEALVRKILSRALPLAGAGVIASACGTPPGPADAGTDSGFSQDCRVTSWVVDLEPLEDGGYRGVGGAWCGYNSPDGACSYFTGLRCSRADGQPYVLDGGPASLHCATGGCTGRVTSGAEPKLQAAGYFEAAAEAEALSVAAFRRLERELRAHRAPIVLVRRARAAARDEIRHARILDAFGRRSGATVDRTKPRRIRLSTRSLREVVIENAVEGCMREAFGAVTGAYQAQHATDARFRAAMISISRDEAQHAQLAFDVHEELSPRLAGEDSLRLRDAIARAAQSFRTSVLRPDALLGIPPARTQHEMAQAFLREVQPQLRAKIRVRASCVQETVQ